MYSSPPLRRQILHLTFMRDLLQATARSRVDRSTKSCENDVDLSREWRHSLRQVSAGSLGCLRRPFLLSLLVFDFMSRAVPSGWRRNFFSSPSCMSSIALLSSWTEDDNRASLVVSVATPSFLTGEDMTLHLSSFFFSTASSMYSISSSMVPSVK